VPGAQRALAWKLLLDYCPPLVTKPATAPAVALETEDAEGVGSKASDMGVVCPLT
jgi:hypothetical protein